MSRSIFHWRSKKYCDPDPLRAINRKFFCIFPSMKTIIITGANGNLGVATVKKFLDNNYRVIGIARSGSNLGFATGHKYFELHQLDLTDENAVISFIKEAISLYGSIEGALFLAGGFAMGNLAGTHSSDFYKMLSLNFETAYHATRVLFEHMVKKGYGRLIFIGAKTALHPENASGALAYALSKSLLFNLAGILNATAKGKNVTASVIVPSIIDTEANRKDMPDADWNKWVKPEQIADVMEFVCSEKGLALREPILKVYNNL